MDSASPQPAGLTEPLESPVRPQSASAGALPVGVAEDLYRVADGEQFELSLEEFASALQVVGNKYNFGVESGAVPSQLQREAFLRVLHLRELALSQACALGRDAAWRAFLVQYRGALTQAAIAITRSSSLGEELADSLYSELFGLAQRDGVRWSPLSTYSGRGSLMGWLRAMLAQRHVTHFRQTRRESPLDDAEAAGPAASAAPEQAINQQDLARLAAAVSEVLPTVSPEERFLLSAYYLDQRTLLQIAAVLRVHEATVSRKLKRAAEDVRKKLLKALQRHGMSRQAAQETLGADPRDLELNLRKLLQVPVAPAFNRKEGGA